VTPSRLPPIDFRRLQRIASTDAEERIWWLLRNRHLGAKFRRQRTIGPFTVDFYCLQLKLAVEIDGAQHREEDGLLRDGARDAFLNAKGITVLRFTNREALADTPGVAAAIFAEVERLCPHPVPLPR
jgi:very-short-patch-repair endonuclease